ncbi:hypothetical protein N8492_02290 [Synechococcus sp. AH-601-O06]|nr:hypothetical protein [Synechococcus sp. AH-601-O06]
MNNRTRNIVIASVIGVAALASGLKYKQHQDDLSFFDSCQEARQVRRDAARFMGRTVMSGHGGYAAQATVLMQDATDIIVDCNAKGF